MGGPHVPNTPTSLGTSTSTSVSEGQRANPLGGSSTEGLHDKRWFLRFGSTDTISGS